MAATANGWLFIRFIDEVRVEVRSGDGGPGCRSFLREKLSPRGGPDGGNGGRGGDVRIIADPGLATLLDLRYRRLIKAQRGRPGGANNRTGAAGAHAEIRVPVGTQIYDDTTATLLHDLTAGGEVFVVAKGGRGGRGNAAFATASRRSPEHTQPGEPGEGYHLRFELKLLADVGLVGFPNAGKSTLISRISNARPKIADYPFTTLAPNLGVVKVDLDRSYVVADIPGLIEGAADGLGLGHQFLRHIERTSLLVFLVTQDLAPDRDPVSDYHALRHELSRHDPQLLERPSVVVLSQCDRPDVAALFDGVQSALGKDVTVLKISAVSGLGLPDFRSAVAKALVNAGRWAP